DTGVKSGDDLKRARARRTTHQRIEKLEETKDEHIALFHDMRGQLGTLVSHAERTEKYREEREAREERARERDRVRKWIIALITAIAAAVATIYAAVH